MTVKFVEWASGVAMPIKWTKEDEAFLRRAYEQGVRDGRSEIRQPIISALGLDEE